MAAHDNKHIVPRKVSQWRPPLTEIRGIIFIMEKEIWKDISGFPDYQVSNLGRVKRIHNIGRNGLIRILKPSVYSNGYKVVNLLGKRIGVHRLVAMAFIPNPNELPLINHKNENKADNRVENLEWCTQQYNVNYGTRNKRVSEKLSKSVLQISIDGILVNQYYGIHEAMRQTGIDARNIHSVLKGKRRTTGGFIWKYA